MRRAALALPTVAIIALVLVSCTDTVAPRLDGTRGRALSTEAQAVTQVMVCHAAGRASAPRFVPLTVTEEVARTHLDERGTPVAGHEQDYLVTGRTPCPPPPTPGQLRVCKDASLGIAAGTVFTFLIAGQTTSIPAGSCVVREYRVGTTVSVQETGLPSGVQLAGITIAPTGAGTTDLGSASAAVIVGTDVAEVHFTNRSPTHGGLTICKVAGTGVPIGYTATFMVLIPQPTPFTVPAGAAPDGTCSSSISLPAGTVSLTEVLPADGSVIVSSIVVSPAGAAVTLTPITGTATVTIVAGQETRVTYTNRTPPVATVELCKVAGAGIAVGTPVTFRFFGGSPAHAPVQVPAGTATAPGCVTLTYTLNPPVLPVFIEEQVPVGMILENVQITGAGGGDWSEPSGLTVLLLAEGVTRVVYTNRAAATATVELCKVAGEGVAIGTLFTFRFFGGNQSPVQVPAGTAVAPGCVTLTFYVEPPILGPVFIEEQVPSGMIVENVEITGASGGDWSEPSGLTAVLLQEGATRVTYTNRVAP